jgi:hypothetical protein
MTKRATLMQVPLDRPPMPERFARFDALAWIEQDDLPTGISPREALERARDRRVPDDWQCRAALHYARRRWRLARYDWAKRNGYGAVELDRLHREPQPPLCPR